MIYKSNCIYCNKPIEGSSQLKRTCFDCRIARARRTSAKARARKKRYE